MARRVQVAMLAAAREKTQACARMSNWPLPGGRPFLPSGSPRTRPCCVGLMPISPAISDRRRWDYRSACRGFGMYNRQSRPFAALKQTS